MGTAALAAGELDYSASTDSGIPAAVQGVPIKAVLFAMKVPPFYLISQPGLKKINPLLTMDGRMPAEHLDTEYQNKLISRLAQASEVLDLTVLEEVLAKR